VRQAYLGSPLSLVFLSLYLHEALYCSLRVHRILSNAEGYIRMGPRCQHPRTHMRLMRWPHWEQFITHPLSWFIWVTCNLQLKNPHTRVESWLSPLQAQSAPLLDDFRGQHNARLSICAVCVYLCARACVLLVNDPAHLEAMGYPRARSRSQWNAADRVRVFEYKLAALANDAPRDWWPPRPTTHLEDLLQGEQCSSQFSALRVQEFLWNKQN
jgi:hypothetical protein